MFYLALILLLLVAGLCVGLSRVVATRVLGFVSAGTLLLSGIFLLLDWLREPVAALVPMPAQYWLLDPPPLLWMALDQMVIYLLPELSPGDLVLALTLLFGGTLALLALALTLAPTVRGFGALFAWSLLAPAAAIIGLSGNLLLMPFAWSMAVLLGYGAVRASGALNRSETLPQGLTMGLLASVLLLGGLLAIEPTLRLGETPGGLAIALVIIASVMLAGGAPFHNTFDEAITAPPALGALLYGIVFPVLALDTLLRLVEALPAGLPTAWRITLMLLGLLSLLAGSAGALREHSLRRLLGWQASAQAGGVILAVGVGGPLAALAAPVLVINLVLTTLAGSLAATILERLTGSDDFTQTTAVIRLRVPGLVWGLAAASAVGLPPLWGFWGKRWLLDAAVIQAPWVVPPLLAASLLAAVAYLGPLAKFLGGGTSSRAVVEGGEDPAQADTQQRAALQPGDLLVLFLTLLPLLLLGIWPHPAWQNLLQAVPGTPATLPVSTPALIVNGSVGLLGLLVFGLLLWRGSARRTLPDPDVSPVVLAPDALAQSLTFLSRLGRPDRVLQQLWRGLEFLSDSIAAALAPFEQRYYLAAVFLAVISVIVLMAQA
jgi:formate hydrogenlyase subunit 3/multisubunit Na+/H+ antiporter MnhD subunit